MKDVSLWQAYDLLRQAREEGFQPDVHTYSSLIKGAVKQNNLESAMSVYKDMLEARIEPSVVSPSKKRLKSFARSHLEVPGLEVAIKSRPTCPLHYATSACDSFLLFYFAFAASKVANEGVLAQIQGPKDCIK